MLIVFTPCATPSVLVRDKRDFRASSSGRLVRPLFQTFLDNAPSLRNEVCLFTKSLGFNNTRIALVVESIARDSEQFDY